MALIANSDPSVAIIAQQKQSARDMMNEMKAKYGKTFDQCQSLAVSRGYNLTDNENESRAVAMFVMGCVLGQQK